ncbi:Ig-like domain-containing protein [Leifsonia sp. LS-T14]|uniref:Ig-like domain-containing protein n=1 Tax=unclassified Leifsonia TaxID=2663824 RepID=UPI0035A586DC
MNVNKSTRRRLIVGTGATVLAATALSLFAATGANAATGTYNGGVRDIRVVPTAPAKDFGTAGTTGKITINKGSGYGPAMAYLDQYDTNRYFIRLPAGLTFGANACAGLVHSDNAWNATCSVTNGGHDINWYMQAASPGINGMWDQNGDISFPIVSNGGSMAGGVYAQYDQFAGLLNPTGTATARLAESQIPMPAPVAPAAAKLTNLDAVGPTNGQYDLTGKGEPGAAIKVVDANGKTVGTGTVGSDGNWLVKIPQTGTTPPLTITESVNGSVVDTVTFDKEPLPVLNPAVAGGVLALAGLGLGGAVLVRRRRNSSAATAAA